MRGGRDGMVDGWTGGLVDWWTGKWGTDGREVRLQRKGDGPMDGGEVAEGEERRKGRGMAKKKGRLRGRLYGMGWMGR